MLQEQITYPNLPLAICRELAAHLRQVAGVSSQLIPQTSPEFDYCQSQVAGLLVEYAPDIDSQARQQVEEILSYYSAIYGACCRQPNN